MVAKKSLKIRQAATSTTQNLDARKWAWKARFLACAGALVLVALSLGCATYHGTASAAQPSVVAREGQWTMVPNFPLVLQADNDDCGAAALASVVRYWGYPAASPQSIESALGRTDKRLQAGDMETYARSVGLHSYVFFGTMRDIVHELERGRPVIVGLGKMVEEKKAISHYEVVVGYEPQKKQLLLLDPGRGFQVDSLEGFAREWAVSKGVTIVAFPENPVTVTEGTAKAKASSVPSGSSETALAIRTDQDTYAARETTSPEAKKYKAGDVIVISATTLAIILLIVIILILI